MIAYIKGTIEHITDNSLIIENNGIGYHVYVSNNTLSDAKQGEQTKIHTYMNVKEDGITLYGFKTEEEMNMFQLLITVSGIGPKVALMMLSSLTPSQVALAIITDDVNTLTKCQGVGKKTAQRVALELRDKIKTEDAMMVDITGAQQTIEFASKDAAKQDAIEALIALGFSRSESVKHVLAVSVDGMSADQMIKGALKKINTR